VKRLTIAGLSVALAAPVVAEDAILAHAEIDVVALALELAPGDVDISERIGLAYRGNTLLSYRAELDDHVLFASREPIEGWWLQVAIVPSKGVLYEGQTLRRDDWYVLTGRIELASPTSKPLEILTFRLRTLDEASHHEVSHFEDERARLGGPAPTQRDELEETLATADASRNERRNASDPAAAAGSRRAEHERMLAIAEASRANQQRRAAEPPPTGSSRRAEIERDIAAAATSVEEQRRQIDELTADRTRRVTDERDGAGRERTHDELARAEARLRLEALIGDARQLVAWKTPIASLATTTSEGIECDWLVGGAGARDPMSRARADPFSICARLLQCLVAVDRTLALERAASRSRPSDELRRRADSVARWRLEAQAILDLR